MIDMKGHCWVCGKYRKLNNTFKKLMCFKCSKECKAVIREVSPFSWGSTIYPLTYGNTLFALTKKQLIEKIREAYGNNIKIEEI